MNVLVTGVSGYIGGRLLSRLADAPDIQHVFGVDLKPPQHRPDKLKFYRRDVSQPFADCLSGERIDSAVHLAFVLKPTRNKAAAQRIDVTGSSRFLEACDQAGVKHIICLSSHTVYGAHPDNSFPLTEEAPLRPMRGFQYSWDKAQAEAAFKGFAGSHPEVSLAVLRCCPVIGPNAAGSIAASMFPRVLVRLTGHDPLFQFVQEDDLVDLLMDCIVRRHSGVFNLAADGEVRYSHIAALAGRRMVALPEWLLRPAIAFSWALRLQNESPPSGLDFIKYPPLVSTDKLKREVGFRPRYSSEEALRTFFGRGDE
ncbi:MAG: NAD-dependent epimerase/dehydratase family protein [Dehalococcoidia bacterium]|nr:NAD-dependent epimerase/dehydratase family protein [Dehalococcoidia bacterium]